MKSLKHITAIILCIMLTFSVLTCAAQAAFSGASDEDAVIDATDLSYTPPTEPSTTEKTAIEDIYLDNQSKLDESNENIHNKITNASGFLESIKEFLDMIIEFLKDLSEKVFSDPMFENKAW